MLLNIALLALIALVLWRLAPRPTVTALRAPLRWWPDWRDPLIWRLGIALGIVNALYFTTNAFLPDYLHHIGRADLVSAAQEFEHKSYFRGEPPVLAGERCCW